MIVIGDVHGHFGTYHMLCKRHPDEITVQIGDMGIGFIDVHKQELTGPYLRPKLDWFFRGNHDNPGECRRYAQCLGEGGYVDKLDVPFFFVPGAWSIDRQWRVEGHSWWPDEELSYPQLAELVNEYERIKPDLVLSHEAPDVLKGYLIPDHKNFVSTRTSAVLQQMFEIHKPKRWIFGHYHKNWSQEILGTQFQCLNELSWERITNEN